jgi:hypothetical protein
VQITHGQAGSVQARPTRIIASQEIALPGSYILANDITGTGGDGIAIEASDVTLNLNGHTISGGFGGGGIGIEGNNVHVYNGRIVASDSGVVISGSYCLVNDLNITIDAGSSAAGSPAAGGLPIVIEFGNYNRVHNCVLSVVAGQKGQAALHLFVTSYNSIQGNTLLGTYTDTIIEDDQKGSGVTVLGNNTFSGNKFANPSD